MNVYLIGSRGVGKSTVAPLAALRMGMPWVDLDREIERREGRTVAAIFAADGEAAFRDLETSALERIACEDGFLVATGGGVVLRESNRTILAQGRCIWLCACVPTILERLASGGNRPPLTNLSLEEETAKLLEQRSPLYASVSQAMIIVDLLEPEAAAERVAMAVASMNAADEETAWRKKGGGGSQ
jgi:shikimate kinase